MTPPTPGLTPGDGTEPTRRPIAPFLPAFEHTDLSAIGGRLGGEPADFVVDELPLYPASGTGEHWYVRLGKERATTRDLVKAVALAARVQERDIGYAGMKDKHAQTTQWLSVPAGAATPPEAWVLGPAFRLLEVARHNNKLRTGHLSANRFRIRVVGLEPGAASKAEALCARIAAQGIGNYFGPQRFGVGQNNLEAGLTALVRGRLGRLPAYQRKLLPSVIQAEIFNRYLAARLALGRDTALVGDVMRLEGSRASFVVEDREREQARLAQGEIHLTGPIWGPKMLASHGVPLELEQVAIADIGLSPEALAPLGRFAPGTRRDLLVKPSELRCHAEGESLVFEFVLPAGSYATVLIANVTRSEQLSARSAATIPME